MPFKLAPSHRSWRALLFSLGAIALATNRRHRANATLIPDPVVHFGVGAVAGGMGAVASYPFDYIKSQMQTELGAARYDDGWHALRCTVRENPLNLYRGLGVQVVGIAPEKGIKLGVNDVLRASFLSHMGGFPLWAQVASGATAGACQVIATSPLEVMKVGLQTSDMSLSQVWNRVGGVRGLYRGADACMLRDVLWTAVCFPLYATWVDSSMNPFMAGALSGVVACGVTTPPDVIKTRILSQDEFSIIQDAASASSNPIAVACQIVRQEGIAGLFSGVNERCMGAVPRFGTTLAMHDVLEKFVSHAGWLSHVS